MNSAGQQINSPPSRMNYIRAGTFLKELRKHKKELTKQELNTLRGQALSGDTDGATKGLAKLIAGRGVNDELACLDDLAHSRIQRDTGVDE